jgi:hypothetical protein
MRQVRAEEVAIAAMGTVAAVETPLSLKGCFSLGEGLDDFTEVEPLSWAEFGEFRFLFLSHREIIKIDACEVNGFLGG